MIKLFLIRGAGRACGGERVLAALFRLIELPNVGRDERRFRLTNETEKRFGNVADPWKTLLRIFDRK